MGKYVLLLTFAALVGATYFTQYTSQTSTAASEDQAERQEAVLARQVARSAFSDGMSEVKRNFDDISDGETRSGTYEDGTYELVFAVSTTGDDEREVTVTARGTYPADADAGDREATYYLSGTAERKSEVSSFFSGITVGGENGGEAGISVNGGGCSSGPCISGIDAAGGEDRHGIYLPGGLENPDQETEEICEEFGDSGDGSKIEGKGDGCSVQYRSEEEEEWALQEINDLEERIIDLANKGHEDVTVCVDGDDIGGNDVNRSCSLSGDEEGSGVLYIDDKFEIKGGSQWNGLVFVAGGDGDVNIEVDGGGNEKNINGGLIMRGGDADLVMNGGNRVQYDSEELLKYVSDVPEISYDQIEISDRCGGLVPSGDEVPASCR